MGLGPTDFYLGTVAPVPTYHIDIEQMFTGMSTKKCGTTSAQNLEHRLVPGLLGQFLAPAALY